MSTEAMPTPVRAAPPAPAEVEALLQLECPCGAEHRLPVRTAGRNCQCRVCGEVFRIPYPNELEAGTSGRLAPARVAPEPSPLPSSEPRLTLGRRGVALLTLGLLLGAALWAGLPPWAARFGAWLAEILESFH